METIFILCFSIKDRNTLIIYKGKVQKTTISGAILWLNHLHLIFSNQTMRALRCFSKLTILTEYCQNG